MLDWFTGGDTPYMPRYHCMREDWLTISGMVTLDAAICIGYLVIGLIWWGYEKKHARTDGAAPGANALADLRWIFLLCGVCGYAFNIVAMWWPGYRLKFLPLLALAFFTARFIVRSRRLELVYLASEQVRKLTVDLEATQAQLASAQQAQADAEATKAALEARVREQAAARAVLLLKHRQAIGDDAVTAELERLRDEEGSDAARLALPLPGQHAPPASP